MKLDKNNDRGECTCGTVHSDAADGGIGIIAVFMLRHGGHLGCTKAIKKKISRSSES